MNNNPEFAFQSLSYGSRVEEAVPVVTKYQDTLFDVVRAYGGAGPTMDGLRADGVETIEDLRYQTPEDLVRHGIKLAQARKMLDKYANGGYVQPKRVILEFADEVHYNQFLDAVRHRTNAFVVANENNAKKQAEVYAEQEALHRAEADGFAAPTHQSYTDDGRENCW